MTISKRVQKELVQAVPPSDSAAVRALTGRDNSKQQAAAAKSKTAKGGRATIAALAEANKGKAWTCEEHERFLVALELFPSGPWKAIADYVGSKNSRQTMTHAQKYRQKHERRQRGLRNKAKGKAKARAAATRTTRTSVKIHIDEADEQESEDKSPRSVSAEAVVEGAMDVDNVDMDAPAPAVAVGGDAPPPDWNYLFKQASVTEIFPEFEPMEFLPDMWSTNSLEEMVLGGNGSSGGGGGGRFDFFSAESNTAVV